MSSHSAFEKKCLHFKCDRPDLSWISLRYSEQFVEMLLGQYRPEVILRNILDANEVQKSALEAAYHVLHVPETSLLFSELAVAIGQPHTLHNQVMAAVDCHKAYGHHARDFHPQATVNAFVRLRMARPGRSYEFAHPGYMFLADLTMEAAIAGGHALDSILQHLSVTEIHAAAGALRDQGLPIFSDEMIEPRLMTNDFPYFYLSGCKKDQLKPTFDLLASVHGEYLAQSMLDRGQSTSFKKSLFLSAEQISDRFSESSPISALRRFVASKDDLYKKPTVWLVEAMKLENLWADLSKRESKYLLDEGLLSVEDLDRLPKLAKMCAEQRFSTDLGL